MSNDDTTRRGGKQGSLYTSVSQSGQGDDLPAANERDFSDIPWPRPSQAFGSQICVTDLLSREGRVDDQAQAGRSPGLYPVIAVLAGLLLLGGAIVSSAIALSGPQEVRVAPTISASAVTGADALSPEVINSSFGTTSPAQPGADAAIRAHPADTIVPAPLNPAAGKDPVLSTVLAFYQAVIVSPGNAFGMLAPSMRGPGYAEFQRSWAGVTRVNVDDIRRDGPDTAAVTVSTERSDGSMLRSMQVVRVVPGSPPQIVDARLFSASRS